MGLLLEVVSKPPLGPNLCVGRSVQILEILEYACGLNLTAALILNPIEGFETTSKDSQISDISELADSSLHFGRTT